ncbi:alpha/beta hydrolase [Streptomyces boluensis]|uniref:Alpha/beta fold hydrolase n=1 Tax=Streptomyces boluensis TaxID=1775135 RepID=A0A964XL98_9ACTN|nr:alpha/beta hydrolase [Streptomyces boluensis]NBE51876.1 alpha/beta fold hydrolase [Streptomyces boluensis]
MSTHIRAAALAAATLLAVTTVAGCGDGGARGEEREQGPLSGQRLDWATCSAPSVAQGGGNAPGAGWECATMKAPLDHARPDGETIDVALIRRKATDPDRRIGSLLYNFGGPGGSGVTTLPLAAMDYKKLNSRYDLVSFDPRGVGDSASVKCVDDRTMDELTSAPEGVPDSAAEERELLGRQKVYVAACERNSGKVLPHLTTENTARDMDLMRQVLGDDKLHYFGISYGTELGGTYAHLFPKNVGRAVLDAVVDPTKGTVESAIAQVKGFQHALDNYLESTGKDPEQGTRTLAKLLEVLDEKPLPTATGRTLTRNLATTGIASALYREDSWPYLTKGLNEARAGQGDTLLLLADFYNTRDMQGRYSNQQAAGGAIRCADSSERFTLDDVKKHLPAYEKESPVFGEALAWGLSGCTGWPVRGDHRTPDVSAKGAAPLLVIGNTGDPATPVEGAQRMSDRLGKGVGVTLTVDGEGHGTYGINNCATRAVDAYLLDGKVPKDGKTCT